MADDQKTGTAVADDEWEYKTAPKPATATSDDEWEYKPAPKTAISSTPDPLRGAAQATGLSAPQTGPKSWIDQKLGLPSPSQVGNWLQDVVGDVRHGTTATLPGRVLHGMGAIGTSEGIPESVGEFVGGPAIGPVRAAHGVTQIGEHPVRGINEIVSGAGQAAAPIAAVASPEVIPAAARFMGASTAVQKGLGAIGVEPESAEFAGNIAGMSALARPKIASAIRNRYTTPPVPPGFEGPAAANLAEPAVRQGAEKVFRGVAPSPGDIGFRESLAVATPDLAAIERATPLAKSGAKGGIVKPDMRIRQTVENIDNKLSDIWKEQRQPQIDRNAEAHTMTREQLMGKLQPDEVTAIEKKLDTTIPDNLNLQVADNLLKKVNARLRRVEGMDPQTQALAKELSPTLEDLDGMKKRLHENIGRTLEDRGEPGIKEFNQRYGALSEVRNAMRTRMNPAEVIRMLDDVRVYGGLRGPGILERLHVKPSPGRLIQKGMERLAESGIQPSPTPGPFENAPPRPNRLLPPPTPVLAPPIDTSGPIRGGEQPIVWSPEEIARVARETPAPPPPTTGEVTGIGSVQNPQAVGTRGTAGTRFAPKGLLPGPIHGTPAPQVGGIPPVGFPARMGLWEGFPNPNRAGPGFEPLPKTPVTVAPMPVKPMERPGTVPRETPVPEAPQKPQAVLPGLEADVAKQAEGAAKVKAEELTREANTPRNVEEAAGEMERKSPLFRGTAASPQGELLKPLSKPTRGRPEAVPQSKSVSETSTPDEIHDAESLIRSEIGMMQAGDRPGRYFDESEPGDVRTGSKQIRGGDWRGVKSLRNALPFMRENPTFSPSMLEKALKTGPSSPVYQRAMRRALDFVRREAETPEAKAQRVKQSEDEFNRGWAQMIRNTSHREPGED